MKIKKHKAKMLALILLVAAFSCTKEKKHAVHEKYTCPMHPEIIQDKPGTCPICFMDLVKVGAAGDDDAVLLSESQIRLANISAAPVVKKEIEIKTTLNGKVVVNELETEVISSRVSGRIEKLFFKEVGHRVLVNEPLYEIYSEQLLTLQQEYLLAQRQAAALKGERYESLLTSSRKKLLLFGMTQNQIDVLGEQKRANSRITFLAPSGGVISRIDATEGQYIAEGSGLYRMEKLDKVWVEAELYSNEADRVKVGDIVAVAVSGYENVITKGKVIFLSPELRAGNQIIAMRVEVQNPEKKIIPGMQANVILTRSRKNAIILPIDAVVRDDSGSRVWIQQGDGSFKMKMVSTGEATADEIEITEGIEEQEKVVVSGAYLLYSEMVLKKGLNQHQHS